MEYLEPMVGSKTKVKTGVNILLLIVSSKFWKDHMLSKKMSPSYIILGLRSYRVMGRLTK